MFEIISPNMLKTYSKCPKSFEFKYVKSLAMPVNDDIFETGKNIHALASYYLKKENIDNMEEALNPKEKEIWQYLKNVKCFGYECLGAEYTLLVKLENCYYGGRLDALVKSGNMYYILDYKTGTPPENAKYDFQTMIYLLAVKEFFKTSNVTFVYIDLKNKTEVSIQLSDETAAQYVQKLTEITQKILRNNFSPSQKDCNNCEYGKICYDKILN